MAALTEARLTVVTVDSAPEVALEVVVIMLAGPRDIGAGAVDILFGALRRETDVGDHSISVPFAILRIPLTTNSGIAIRLHDDTT